MPPHRRTLSSEAERHERVNMDAEDYRIEPHLAAQRFMNRVHLAGFGLNPTMVNRAMSRNPYRIIRAMARSNYITYRRDPHLYPHRLPIQRDINAPNDGRFAGNGPYLRWRDDRGARTITRFIRHAGNVNRLRNMEPLPVVLPSSFKRPRLT